MVAALPAAQAQSPFAHGAVVALQGTPHLWIADEHGTLHWGGDTRALAGKHVNWGDRTEVSLAQLRTLPIGDPWLSAGLLKDGDPIYLVKWESDWAQPQLLHIQSIADVELFGINGSNYGNFVLDKATWETRYGLAATGLQRGVLPSAVLYAPTATSAPIAEEIVLNTPVEMPRAMLFVAYTWPVRTAIDEIVTTFTFHNDVELRGSHGLYLIACTPFSIGGDGAYFGLQTNVSDPARGSLGKGAIFSRWYENNETADVRLADTRIPARGWTESGDYEGNFVSVRSRYKWGAGDYSLKVAAQEADEIGQWYGLWVIDGNGNETWIGSLRFSLGAKIDPVCYSTIEVYGWPPIRPASVPYWKVSVNPPTGNGIPADLKDTFYPKNVESLRNTLITVNGERVTFEVGLDYIAHE